jgi:hypothetical protein
MTMRLKFLRFLPERTLDTLAKLQLGAGLGAFEIGETFPSQIFKFWNEGLELLDALGEVVNRKRFRPRPI